MALEELPGELARAADRVSVVLPWGSLLRAVALPDVELLRNIRGVARAGATLEAVFGYDCAIDATQADLPPLTDERIRRGLVPGYRKAGFRVVSYEPLDRAALRALPSTWAKRLAFGRPRDVRRIVAVTE